MGTWPEPGSVVVLDGGLSNALADRGHDLSGALWSARLLRDAPGEIAAVHRAYFEAGAQVATTASYQASVDGFERYGATRAEARHLITRSVTLAREVRDELAADGRQRWVAASVGPYGAVLADGSEYRGRYGVAASVVRSFHAERLDLLVSAGPDLLAVETIPDVDEAEVIATLLDEYEVPAWFSYSISGSLTRAGQPLRDAFAIASAPHSVVAVGINCCTPADVLPAIRLATEVSGRPAVAYPNAGESWDPTTRRWTGESSYDVSLAPLWHTAGAQLIGGCCRVGPTTIRALSNRPFIGPL
ncbi:MAG TPA: homocysteine S-methyltransferase [Kribbellaceae bacterium]|nr:homocysteine S-methyltransferase [Kribbellaceae bacterium]